MEDVFVYAFATFGHPNDFRQTCFLPEKRTQVLMVKSFDLTNSIKVFPDSTLYSIRKEKVNGNYCISYAIYTFAKEKLSERDGTFIGSSIVYRNQIPDENITIQNLNRFHTELISKNVAEDRIIVDHSNDFSLSKKVGEDFDKISLNLKKFEDPVNFNSTGSALVVLSRTNDHILLQNFKKSLLLLNNFDTIFFTSSKEILNFTQTRNIYNVTDEQGFEEKIENLKKDRKQIVLNKITEFEKVKTKLEYQRKQMNSEFENRIKENEVKQAENYKKIQDSKNNLLTQNAIYKSFSKNIEDLIESLNEDKTLEEVNTSYLNHKKQFEQELSTVENPSSLQLISDKKNQAKTPHTRNKSLQNGDEKVKNRSKVKKQDTIKIISYVLNFLLGAAILMILFFPFWKKKEAMISIQDQQHDSSKIIPLPQEPLISKLNPVPNDTVNTDNRKKLMEELIDSMNLTAVVKAIFDKNPKSIGNIYNYQHLDYRKYLFEKNPDAFIKNNGDTILVKKDSLKIIPLFEETK